jgi:hypothetical protein
LAEDTSGPFTTDDLTQLKTHEGELARAERLLQQAKRAGFDMTQVEKDLQEAKQKLYQFKGAFFPGK